MNNKTLYLDVCEFGTGVFAARDVAEGESVEVSPIIYFDRHDSYYIEKTILSNYIFEYGEDDSCLALGYGSLFNHSSDPNVETAICDDFIEYIALRDIKAGEQLLIDYGTPIQDFINTNKQPVAIRKFREFAILVRAFFVSLIRSSKP